MLTHSPRELALFVINQRKKLKLSQAKVGKLVGIKQQTISEFELRPESTKLDTLFRILSALNLDLKLEPKGGEEYSNWKEEW
ncbi:putative DNA-binding transcriptional regulator [Legionella nautarum]|uniref:Putative DNA-binding transcriptional regulator n=1 Tax=Legionella nautarum TaxID=45070 RepID=A0A0W0X4F1_9GAMM|nr:helix-turn-helix domain-containing protein [Legionella nautarum]KTD39423.1 putative DNA-binding transcriptional regulator [Legionella nautarum]